ncbi:MAG: thioredoxin family protein [Betaproteobacteria bacterium]|uniref:Thioredoxin-like fold domain-containing protein n=1 Tax=Thiomonas intermedia (strain K12) TaxID=75379 RepID=D5WZH2_THIK1|nr:thioredoxin family protein [Betaproteobacteria bacterium]
MTCAIGSHDCPIRFEILGSGLDAEKLKRRLSCALGGLGWRAQIRLQADAHRALDLGATRDPVLLADGVLFAQGLPRTEELEALLRARIGVPPDLT